MMYFHDERTRLIAAEAVGGVQDDYQAVRSHLLHLHQMFLGAWEPGYYTCRSLGAGVLCARHASTEQKPGTRWLQQMNMRNSRTRSTVCWCRQGGDTGQLRLAAGH